MNDFFVRITGFETIVAFEFVSVIIIQLKSIVWSTYLKLTQFSLQTPPYVGSVLMKDAI